MRYIIDTNIFVYLATEYDQLSKKVKTIIENYDNTFCISAESVKELIVAYRHKGITSKRWKTANDMVISIEKEFNIKIEQVNKNVLTKYANLTLNIAEGHNDPSDHIIISQAIDLKIPLISSDHKFKFYEKQGLKFVFNEK